MSEQKRVALITGAAQGIGKAVAFRLLDAGWAVCAADVDAEACEEVRAELSARGQSLVSEVDVSDEGHVSGWVAQAVTRFGRIDALVNNAGIAKAHGPPPTGLEREAWDRVLAVNLTGPFLCAKHAAPHLALTRGAIVNVASTRALMSEPHTEAYSASKGGLVALTHALAASLGPDVRVNCVSPGWIEVGPWKKSAARRESDLSDADHAQHPCGRVGRPEDVAAAVSFLLSADAGFVTGANFVVDGGMTRKMLYV